MELSLYDILFWWFAFLGILAVAVILCLGLTFGLMQAVEKLTPIHVRFWAWLNAKPRLVKILRGVATTVSGLCILASPAFLIWFFCFLVSQTLMGISPEKETSSIYPFSGFCIFLFVMVVAAYFLDRTRNAHQVQEQNGN